jgi:hypothetical protein
MNTIQKLLDQIAISLAHSSALIEAVQLIQALEADRVVLQARIADLEAKPSHLRVVQTPAAT